MSDNSVAVCSNAISFLSAGSLHGPDRYNYGLRAVFPAVKGPDWLLLHGMRALRKPCAARFGLQLAPGMLTSKVLNASRQQSRIDPKQG